MSLINRVTSHLSASVNAPYSLRLFSILVYLWFLINVAMVWPLRDMLWGLDNVFYRLGHANGVVENFFYQLIYDATRFHVIFYVHVISAVLSLVEYKWSFIPRLITWMTGLMLYYAAVEAFNSGMLLMLLMAFYCSVVYSKSASPYRNAITNVARIACIVQVLLVYATASIFKLSGEQWLAGDAMYYTLHIGHFSASFWQTTGMVQSKFLMSALTYFGLIYQLIFPVIIWLKKGRSWMLIIGVIFHLFIGVVLHLWDFALAMIFCYALFVTEDFAKKLMPFRTLRIHKN